MGLCAIAIPAAAPVPTAQAFGPDSYRAGASEAFEVHGAIQAKYVGLGGEKSCLGCPTSDEQDWYIGMPRVGRMNKFQKSEIKWRETTGVVTYRCY